MKKSFLALAISGLTLVGAPAFAAGPYIFGQVGKSDVDAGEGTYANSLDDTDTYFGIGMGFQVSENLGFEIGYHNFGKIEASYGGTYPDGFADGKESVELDAVSVAAVGTLPIGPSVGLYGKVGLDLWNAEWKDRYREDSPLGYLSQSDTASDDGADIFFAAGATFYLSEFSSIFIEYQVHQFDVSTEAYGDESVDLDVDVDTLSVGINYSF